MPSFEEEAFARAQQMHRRTQSNNTGSPASAKRQTPQNQAQGEGADEPKQEAQPKAEASEKPNALDGLLQDKERSLILLLIVLLMDENPEPTLLLALMYLLL